MKSIITEELLTRYLAGHCTPAEEQLIAEWYASFDHLLPYFENENSATAIDLKAKTKTAIKSIIAGQKQAGGKLSTIHFGTQTMRKSLLVYSSVAAAILILLTAGLYWMLSKSSEAAKKVIVKNAPSVTDTANITPGANKAILTLADGTSVVLDNAANGTLALQNNVQVVKSKDGELKYQPAIGPARREQPAMMAYNKLSTPRGGQYTITLPDGSKVWLNAASSIKYPTAFTGDERRVEITGEVYFEVAKISWNGKRMPFKVIINSNTTVKVLGTHFNVNAYGDDGAVKTTLLEGKVKVVKRETANGNRQSTIGNWQSTNGPASKRDETANDNTESAILKPGEQAIIASHSPFTIDHSPDIESVMAWKNGLFQFNNVTIETVMRQVARWYDVQVVYERDVSQDLFCGKIYRNTDISQLFKILELSGAHFKIEGKKVIVQ